MSSGWAAVRRGAFGCLVLLSPLLAATASESAGSSFPLDTTYASTEPVSGLLQLQLDGLPAAASAVRTLPDGTAIVALSHVSQSSGFVTGFSALVKLRPDGSMDTSFGTGSPTSGVVSLPSGVVDMALDSQNRIVIAGDGLITRLLGDGTPDTTFVSTCGSPCTSPPPPPAPSGSVHTTGGRIYDMSVLADDSIVVETSTEFNQSPYVMNLAKFTPTGDLDPTFNSSGAIPGVLTIDEPGPAWVVPQIDGSFLVVPQSSPPRLHRVTAGGTLDTGLGAGTGVVNLAVAQSDEIITAVEPDGSDRLVVQLSRWSPAGPASLVRVTRDGATDATFGTGGRVELAQLGAQYIDPFFVQRHHRIIVEVRRLPDEVALARLTPDGHLDASFNSDSANPGWLSLDLGPDAQHLHEMAGLAEVAGGKLLAAGHRPLRLWPPTDDVAEIYRFSSFPASPIPTPLAPMPSWPITSVIGGAIATTAAERLAVAAP